MLQQTISMKRQGCIQLQLFQEDFLAKISVQQTQTEKDCLESVRDCGTKCCEPFAKLGPDGLWQKIPQDCLQLTMERISEQYCEGWPKAGTMRNGLCYRHAQWVHHTHEKGCSLLLTPTANDCKPAGIKEFQMMQLAMKGIKIPTTYKRLRSQLAAIEGMPGEVNPEFLEYLMGFPIGYTEINALETQ